MNTLPLIRKQTDFLHPSGILHAQYMFEISFFSVADTRLISSHLASGVWAFRPSEYVQHKLDNLQLHAGKACLYAGDVVGGGGGNL